MLDLMKMPLLMMHEVHCLFCSRAPAFFLFCLALWLFPSAAVSWTQFVLESSWLAKLSESLMMRIMMKVKVCSAACKLV